MTCIVRLPEDLTNQIAAGEVVERPASVVKELVENSIDAQASKVQVDIVSGGVAMIRITDDGLGMAPDDALLALERHATSKIKRIDDLLALSTFGFRGEALPSIASVSRFVLRTRQRDNAEGLELRVEGGAPPRQAPCGIAPGTIIEVRDLFFNVPARRKFLKSLGTESGAISGALEGLALSAPGLSLVLTRDGRPARQWLRAANRKQRVLQARPDDQLAEMTAERGPLRMQAFLAPPQCARSGATGLVLLVNGRVVRDRALLRVLAHAYGSVLEAGRYPVGVVYLDIDPQLVDVNVHPQKAEVRFADTRAVLDAVHSMAAEGLASAFGLSPHPSRAPSAPCDLGVLSAPRGLVPAPVAEPAPAPVVAAPSPVDSISDSLIAAASTTDREPEADPWGLAPQAPAPVEPVQTCLPLHPAASPSVSVAATPASRLYANLRFLAQARGTFLICESDRGLAIIDQHAAAERVNFARLRASFATHAIASQRLLVPVSVAVNADEEAFIEESAALISSLGMDLRMLGPATASIHAVPQMLKRAHPDRLARDLLDELTRTGGRDYSGAVDRVLATMACHGSIRAGDAISIEEVHALLQALDTVDHSGHCPHGRPLVFEVSFAELERQVARR